jgi:hypothetical protein
MDAFALIRDWISDFGPDQWMAVASAIVALVSFLFNWRLVAKQEKRAGASLRLAHDSDIIRWSDEVIETLSEINETLCEKGVAYPDADFRTRRMGLRARLSALIDRGRLFFPNRAEGEKGLSKQKGFQGSRQPALEVLVQSYDLLGRAGDAPGQDFSAANELTLLRKVFVSEIFQTIDPERRGMTLKEIT